MDSLDGVRLETAGIDGDAPPLEDTAMVDVVIVVVISGCAFLEINNPHINSSWPFQA